ncbi:hypothetical protein EDD27_2148 [Nonomuraea polychroma]|uniref:Uncharacterized protein n=1 Tax=Nonomuraea polychroma TaxID=46176 RepID=A0A438M1V9_9ACTN|nr:hypothetical protein EDD27_2148 [Nonomuraea polychroma]
MLVSAAHNIQAKGQVMARFIQKRKARSSKKNPHLPTLDLRTPSGRTLPF